MSRSRVLTLVKDGTSDYTIIIDEKASSSELHAAKELQRFLREITGCKLPIATNSRDSKGNMILVGQSEKLQDLKEKLTQFGDEGFIIKTVGPHLILAGGKLRGTLYAVYTFLGEKLGCRWYTPRVTIIPKKSQIEIEPLDEEHKPSFEWRMISYLDAADRDWSARNRLNGEWHKLDEATGGNFLIKNTSSSRGFYEMVPPDKYFNEHPEYYSLVDGRRVRALGQLCLTNPSVAKIVTDYALDFFERNPQYKAYGIIQNDWAGWCECPECRVIIEREGANSGTLIHFINRVAEEVEKKHPDKYIYAYAYTVTVKAPKHVKPRKNVILAVSHMYPSCDSHPVVDPIKCEMNARFVKSVKEWAKISKRLYIKHYSVDFAHYLLPFPNFTSLAESIRWYKDMGVEGIHCQGDSMPGGGGEFEELRSYVLAQLMWNACADVDEIIDDFLMGYYGKASRPIREYFDMLHNKVRDEHIHVHLYSGPEAGYLTQEVIGQAKKYFDDAERMADDEEVLNRVKKARLSIQYAELVTPIESILFHESVWPLPFDMPREYMSFLRQPKYAPLLKERLEEGLAQRQKLVEEFIANIKRFGIRSHQEWVTIDGFLERIRMEAQKYPAMIIHNASSPVKEAMNNLVDWMERYKEPGYEGSEHIIDIHKLVDYAESIGLPSGWSRGVVGWLLDRGLLKRSDIHLWLVKWTGFQAKEKKGPSVWRED